AAGRWSILRLPACDYLYGSILASLAASASSTTVVPRRPRFRFVVLLLRMCCLNALLRRNLPRFVRLKRLAAPRWVLSFGILTSPVIRRRHLVAGVAVLTLLVPCGRRLRIVCI